jgi:hypothetical protein
MPVTILPLGEKKLKISGSTSVKMTDFKIQPPSVALIHLVVGDEVKLTFDWMVGPRPAAEPPADQIGLYPRPLPGPAR